MYYAVFKDGACIAKIVAETLNGYTYPFPHDELVADPDNTISVQEES